MGTDFIIVFWYWFALAGIAVLLEMLVPGVFFLFLAVGAATVGIVLLAFPSLDLAWQLVIFVSIAVVAAYVGRKYLPYFQQHRHALDSDTLNKRGAEFVGQSFTLIEPIVAGRGRARIGDSTWTVTGPDAPIGAVVEVIASNGTELCVKPRAI